MRVQVQVHDLPSRAERHFSTCPTSNGSAHSSSLHVHNNIYDEDYESDSLEGYIACSQHSGSENATASDLPGPGHTVGKLFNRLGHSLEAMIAKRGERLMHWSTIRVASSGGRFDDNSVETVSQDSFSVLPDEVSLLSFSHSQFDNSSEESVAQPHGETTRRLNNPDIGSCSTCSSGPVASLQCSSFASSAQFGSLAFSLTTCSLSRSLSTNATLSDLSGPGRVLGRGYAALGKMIEDGANRLLSGRSPDAVAERLDPVLRKLLRHDFLLQYEDVEKAELSGMEDSLGVRSNVTRQSEKKHTSGIKRIWRKRGDDLLTAVKRVIEQSCIILLEQASNPALHDMQIRALVNILELAANYPIARGCFVALAGRDRIATLPLEVVVPVNVTRVDGHNQWPEGHSQGLGDALKALFLLRARCVIALGDNDVYILWRAFFLAGDEYEQEKIVLRLLTFFGNRDLAFLAARAMTSILRRPVHRGRCDLSETTWSELFLTLFQLVMHQHNHQVRFDKAVAYRTNVEPDTLDALIRAALERASLHLGKLSIGFSDEGSPLMSVVNALHGHESSPSRYPIAAEFASMLVPSSNLERMRRESA